MNVDSDFSEWSALFLLSDSIENGLNLRSNNRQYIKQDSVELIEASPGTRECETCEHLSERNDIHLIGAVHNDNKEGKTFSKILDSLGLSSTGWSLWSTTSLHVKGVSESHVSSVSKWGDNKSSVVTLILISVLEGTVGLIHQNLELVTLIIGSSESELGKPVESLWSRDLLLVKLINKLTVVLIDNNQRHNLDSLELLESWLFNQLDVVLNLLLVVGFNLSELILLSTRLEYNKGTIDLSSPLKLAHSDQDLTWILLNDSHHLLLLISVLGTSRVLVVVLVEESSKRSFHLIHQLFEPGFNLWINSKLSKRNSLVWLIIRLKFSNLVSKIVLASLSLDSKGCNTLKHLSNVLKDWFWVLRLTNDLKKILIREEVESWELTSLGFQELVQVLLDLLEFLVQVIQEWKEILNDKRVQAVLGLGNSLHLGLESGVVLLEDGVLVWKLLRDIWLTSED